MLRNGGYFSLVDGFLVMAVDGLDLVHLDRLGDADADFGLLPATLRPATL